MMIQIRVIFLIVMLSTGVVAVSFMSGRSPMLAENRDIDTELIFDVSTKDLTFDCIVIGIFIILLCFAISMVFEMLKIAFVVVSVLSIFAVYCKVTEIRKFQFSQL